MKNIPAVGLIGLALVLAGCGPHNPSAHSPLPPAPGSSAVSPAAPASNTPALATGQVVVYTVDPTHGSEADNYLVPRTVPLKDSHDPAREALDALLQAPDTPMPPGTALKSLKVADGLATVDFSRSPVDETHGEEKQAEALEALQLTLGQFPQIARIQIEINGRMPDSIGEAAGGPMDVIRPGPRVPEAGGA